MDLTRRHLIGATALLCAGCGGGGGSDTAAPSPAPNTTHAGTPAAATYRATLTSRWNAATFTTRFPASAHLTGLVGATHADTVSFWAEGRAASLGVKDVAERGSKSTMLEEVAHAIAAGTAGSALSGDGVPVGASHVTLDFSLTQTHSQVTLLSMLGPSPDWFIGVSGLPLFENGAWRSSVLLDLRIYDSGTDDGASFTSPDAISSPASTVRRLSTPAADTDFIDGVHRSSGAYLATIEFALLR